MRVAANVDNSSALGVGTITVPPMVKRGRVRSRAHAWVLMVAVMALGSVAGCAASVGGTAMGSSGRGSPTSRAGEAVAGTPATPSSAVASPVASGEQVSGGAASGSAPPGPGVMPGRPTGAEPARPPDTGWTADVVLTGGPGDIVSPTGDLMAVVDHRGVCLHAGRPDDPGRVSGSDAGTGTGVGQCVLTFADGVTPAFAVFSPTGAHLLVVAGPAAQSQVYVIDARSWGVQSIGPQGVGPLGPTTVPRWDLSSAAWDVDGAAVLLVPRTGETTGAVLGIELTGGAPYPRVRLPAGLANSSPSVWSTDAGLAVVANAGDQRSSLWWADFATGAVQAIATFDDPQGSLALSAADPLGRTVLVCPRQPSGALGATVGIAVADRRSAPVRPGSRGCAGAVFSADGSYLALADQLAGGYTVTVVDASSGATVLSVPLPVPAPSAPPYLTWTGDVIVVSDVSGQWPLSAALLRIAR